MTAAGVQQQQQGNDQVVNRPPNPTVPKERERVATTRPTQSERETSTTRGAVGTQPQSRPALKKYVYETFFYERLYYRERKHIM